MFVIQSGEIDHIGGGYLAISKIEGQSFWNKNEALKDALHFIAFMWDQDGCAPDDIPLPNDRADDSVRVALSEYAKWSNASHAHAESQAQADEKRLADLYDKLCAAKEVDLQFWFNVLSRTADGDPWIAVTEIKLPPKTH